MNEKTEFALIVMTVIVLIGVLLAIAIPSFVKARNTSEQNACLGNLMIISAAKDQAYGALPLTDGDTVTTASVNQFIKGNATPVCSGGGTYTYGKIGSRPDCSITTPTSHFLCGA